MDGKHRLRIIIASFCAKERRINMNVIQCYAPINDSEDEKKKKEYMSLSKLSTVIL